MAEANFGVAGGLFRFNVDGCSTPMLAFGVRVFRNNWTLGGLIFEITFVAR